MSMVMDNLAMFESPIQILIVLTIALLVFGPKKLPEIGRQIGGALRELRKAAGEVSRSFTTEYEPEAPSYSYQSSSAAYEGTASYYTPPPALEATSDLSDYTIVGVTPAAEIAQVSSSSDVDLAQDLTDYTLTGTLLSVAASPILENTAEVEGAGELDAQITNDLIDGAAPGMNGIAKGSAQS